MRVPRDATGEVYDRVAMVRVRVEEDARKGIHGWMRSVDGWSRYGHCRGRARRAGSDWPDARGQPRAPLLYCPARCRVRPECRRGAGVGGAAAGAVDDIL